MDFHTFGFRILKTKDGYALFEVYYNKKGKIIATLENSETGEFDDLENLKSHMQLMMSDLELPVLDHPFLDKADDRTLKNILL